MAILNKPRVFEKFKQFHDYEKKNNGEIGIKKRGIDLNLNNVPSLIFICNLIYCLPTGGTGEVHHLFFL